MRVRLIKGTVVIAFVIGFLLSPQLWIDNGRFFPTISPIDGMFVLPPLLNLFLLILFVVLGVGWIFFERREIGLIAIVSLVIVIAQDQMRWQPWVYLYLLMLLPHLVGTEMKDKNGVLLLSLQCIVAGVYLWSGIQKINPNFIDGIFTQMMEVSGIGLESPHGRNAGYFVPFIEILIGLALLIPKIRTIGMCAAVVVHIFILLYFVPMVQNNNSIVYPWNIAMILIVIILFWKTNETGSVRSVDVGANLLMAIPIALVWLFPILNLFGYWDHYLSFSLYSNKPSSFYIAIEEGQVHKIDKRFKKYFAEIPGLKGGQIIDINRWALSELNVPFYPEIRSFKKLSANFCSWDIDDDKLIFLELSNVKERLEYRRFTCKDVRP